MGRAAEPELLGSQAPTHRLAVDAPHTRGPEAIALAELAGIELDEWQQQFLLDALRVREDGKWAAFEAGIELSRQNGKSKVFYVLALAGIYLFDERLVVYTAHKGETVGEAHREIDGIIQGCPELRAEWKKTSNTNGKEYIELLNGARIKFRTRTSGGGRGLSGDRVILDEAQDLDDEEQAALLPVLTARPNPQVVYGGSAGGQDSVAQGRLVQRCIDRDDGLVYYRWAADEDDDPADPKTWAKANPALGRRIDVDRIRRLQGALAVDKFAREHLGMGDYPRPEGEEWVIPRSKWELALDPASRPVGPVVFAVEVTPNRDWGAIAVAGRRRDGARHGEVVQHERGTRWIGPRLVTLLEKNPHLGVVIDPGGPAGSLIGEIEDLGIKVTTMTSSDLAKACGGLYDAVIAEPPEFRHRGAPVLDAALAAASTRRLQDSWAWQRRGSDSSPLVAVTLAVHGLLMLATPPKPPARPLSASSGRFSPRRELDLATVSF